MAIVSNHPQAKIDVGKALELRMVKGWTYQQIATHFSCTKSAVGKALGKYIHALKNPEITKQFKERKAELLESVQSQLICDLVDPKRRKKASLNNTAYAVGQLDNMIRLERGQSTENVAYQELTAEGDEIQARKRELQEMLLKSDDKVTQAHSDE